jgi:hypothetical protein
LRTEFLDPFFKELGWDMENKEGYSEAYKEVIHEDAIKMCRVVFKPGIFCSFQTRTDFIFGD